MPVRYKLETKGFSEYLEKLARAGKAIDPIADVALTAGGDVLLAGMDRRVPRDTGNLQAHLERSEPEQDGNFHSVTVGISADTDADTARYGAAQEYGWGPDHPAQAYIRPAIDEDMKSARGCDEGGLYKVFIWSLEMTIWEITKNALTALGVPMAANRYLVPTGQQLPDQYIIYQLISSPPELHAENVEKYRSYRMQVTIWDRTGLANLPNIPGVMVAAGFGRVNRGATV
jgi:hypothetical protein